MLHFKSHDEWPGKEIPIRRIREITLGTTVQEELLINLERENEFLYNKADNRYI